MSIFDWQEDYVIDNAMIDEQHKRLLILAEKLFNAVIDQSEDTKIFFDELLAYTQKHFDDEEAYFKNAGATGWQHHAREHQTLAEELLDVWKKEALGFQSEKGRILLNWVEERLLPHMMIDDQETFATCS
ncbi:hemerythrin domain-containing protein [Terasakiella sp. A23]|uniref:bacteriohemerythrin n=1 Tax=Terasakiella sp. FCG-A23 TaxID=3080561 RepID=UPI0029546B1C|nr:hemerythrin domain-containing protein [Terasakiella sp. A23]MDV7339616.1 hemerythrin domain-containing protein [Terasakiella sp. A23]